MIRRSCLLAATVALGACASKGDVTRLQDQIAQLQVESSRMDSIQAVRLAEVIRLQRQVFDSLAVSGRAIGQVRGDLANDLYNIQQQLVQLQELTGQSQRRLSELRTQLEARGAQIQADQAPPVSGDTAAGVPAPAGPAASADQMYEASLAQLRRGSTGTARLGLRQLLESHPTSERVPDALYFIGQSFAAESPDSAARYYTEVVQSHPDSPRAPAALYNLGLLAERRKDSTAARDAYQRVVQRYPQSDEAALARDRLRALGR